MNHESIAIEAFVSFMICMSIFCSVGATIALTIEKRKGMDIGWVGLLAYAMSLLSVSALYIFVHLPRT